MGPTASGKTSLAVELVQRFPLDIISVDSALVYRGMDIGTAKPDADTLARAPHRLIDLRDPDQPYSAAEFRADALREMAEITASGRVPLLVGGTMLYFRALEHGLARMPAADEEVRRAIEARARRLGWPALHAELAEHDPETAARIEPTDPQRIQRALEVFKLTGRPLSEWHRREQTDPFPYRVLKIIVAPTDRAELHRRIEQRFDAMMADGFEAEARALHDDDAFDPELPAMRAVGYRQAWPWLEGQEDRAAFRAKALAATRQLAKRQLTWLRREQGALWYDPAAAGAPEADGFDAPSGVASIVGRFLESPGGRSQIGHTDTQ